jgi:transcriptional regulator with XRE-family HTH domain
VTPSELGTTIRRLREESGLTQAQLAERVSVTSAYLARLEAGEHDHPSLDIVRRLARALKVPLNRLL